MISGDSATVVGEYTAVFELIDADNYTWETGTQLNDNGDYELIWNITPRLLNAPTLDTTASDYSPSGVANTIKGMNTTSMSLDTGDSGNVTANVTDGVVTLKATMQGVYTVYVGLKTSNFAWADDQAEGTVIEDNKVVLQWTVNRIEVTLGPGDNSFEFNGMV